MRGALIRECNPASLRGCHDMFKNNAFIPGGSPVAGTDQVNIAELMSRHESDILSEWMRAQLVDVKRSNLIDENELRRQSREFLGLLRAAVQNGVFDDISGRDWDDARRLLEDLSRSRARLGFTPTQTATFVFSLKEPLFARI